MLLLMVVKYRHKHELMGAKEVRDGNSSSLSHVCMLGAIDVNFRGRQCSLMAPILTIVIILVDVSFF